MAKSYQSRMTSKGQVTIPAELRRELGLKSGDRVEFVRENGKIQVQRAESVVLRVAGSIRAVGPPLTPDEIHEIAADAMAEHAMKGLHEE